MTIRQQLLQTFYPALMKLSGFAQKKHTASHAVKPIVSIYDLEVIAINGEPFDLHQAVGKKLMIVNTASDCGYTKQLGALESLWQRHSKQLLILGFPSNDFREQETGSDDEIAAFCQKNYGVSFPMLKKAGVVINPNQQPVYRWLTDPAQNGWNKTPPAWNFNKFIVDE
jgi:glutathione peroxidase